MKTRILIEAITLLVIGILSIIEGSRLTTQKNPQILYDVLGPGLYVVALGFFLMVTGIVHFFLDYRKTPGIKKVSVSKEMRNRLISMIVVYAIYTYLVGVIGYLVSTIIFFLLEFRIVGVKSWITNVIISLVAAAISYIVFVLYCNVAFPKGIFL